MYLIRDSHDLEVLGCIRKWIRGGQKSEFESLTEDMQCPETKIISTLEFERQILNEMTMRTLTSDGLHPGNDRRMNYQWCRERRSLEQRRVDTTGSYSLARKFHLVCSESCSLAYNFRPVYWRLFLLGTIGVTVRSTAHPLFLVPPLLRRGHLDLRDTCIWNYKHDHDQYNIRIVLENCPSRGHQACTVRYFISLALF